MLVLDDVRFLYITCYEESYANIDFAEIVEVFFHELNFALRSFVSKFKFAWPLVLLKSRSVTTLFCISQNKRLCVVTCTKVCHTLSKEKGDRIGFYSILVQGDLS